MCIRDRFMGRAVRQPGDGSFAGWLIGWTSRGQPMRGKPGAGNQARATWRGQPGAGERKRGTLVGPRVPGSERKELRGVVSRRIEAALEEALDVVG